MQTVPIRLGRLRTTVRETAPTSLQILTHGDDASSSRAVPLISAASSGRVCRVCTTHASRYTCPRCNLPYCSVDCYRSHGESCTEKFYQELVTNEMAFDEKATAAVDPKAQRARATQELLSRVKQFHEETSAAFGDEQGGDTPTDAQLELSMERLMQLSLMDDSELSLESLTEEERARFLADLTGGRMSKYVTPWEPWWLIHAATYETETQAKRKKLIIEEIGSDEVIDVNRFDGTSDNGDDDAPATAAIENSRFPAALFTVEIERTMPPSTHSLVRGASGVSPMLKFHLVELLFSYAWTMRSFNGDWTQDPEDAALAVLHGCDVLREDARFESLDAVALKCMEQRDVDSSQQTSTNRLVLADAVEILRHRVFILDALTDMIQMVNDAAQEIKKSRLGGGQKKSSGSKQDRAAVRMLLAVGKKIEFYRVWRFHVKGVSDLVEITGDLGAKLEALADLG